LSRLPRYHDRDLVLAGSLAIAGVLVTLLPLPDWVRTLLLLPVLLLVPGYALAAAIFPPRYITIGERLTLVAVCSIGTWVLGGLLLQSAFGLDRGLWLGLLLATTLVSCVIAQSRRDATPVEVEPPHRDLPRPGAVAIVAGALAVATCVAAIAVASDGAQRQLERSHFTALWITAPDAGPARPGGSAAIGVQNHEHRSLVYRLRVSRAGEMLSERSFRLADGGERQFSAAAPRDGNGALVAALFRDGTIYRRVALKAAAP